MQATKWYVTPRRKLNALQEIGEVFDHCAGLHFGFGEVVARGDTGESEDSGHADARCAFDVAFQVVADEDAPFRPKPKPAAEFREEDGFGLAAESGGDVCGVSEHGGG